jgi:hypothetical protein
MAARSVCPVSELSAFKLSRPSNREPDAASIINIPDGPIGPIDWRRYILWYTTPRIDTKTTKLQGEN